MRQKKKTKSFALALRLRARAATLLIALLCGVTGAWADNNLYLEVSGTSATLKYGDKGSNPYHTNKGWSSSDFRSTVTTITVDASCNSHSETSFKKLFYDCTKLTTINGLGNLKTAGVTDMSEMFYYDAALTTLDLSTWNTASVTDMSSMFNSCSELATIYVGGGWSTASVSASNSMFFGCPKLPNYNSSVVDKTKAHTGDGGYLTAPVPGTAVDLGLPSGKKWADRNVGALSATGYGTYYAWAATASQADYSQANAPYYSGSAYTKYTGSDYTMLQRGDDAATVNWGSNWRMPTDTELQELIDNTTKEWKTNYNETGVNGYLVTSKTNGNSIFLPAAGWYNGTELRSASQGGNYWMSTVVTSDVSCGYSLNFYSTGYAPYKDNTDTRYVGFSIRPVQMFAGEGTEASPYLIASTTDWNNLVSAVNGGETYSGNYFKMTANVGTVSTWMTGTFSGTFDGDGKTLTVGYSNTTADVMCAPFGTLNGATIQNLKVAGSISSNQKFIAGIAAWCSSTGNNVTNCLVSATINSSYSGNAADGGLVSLVDDGASLNVTGCAFAGKMLTTNGTTSCGGIVGWRRPSGTATITNCLYAPTSATGSETWIASAEGENGNANFCRWNSSEPTITNCYYTTDFGSGSYTAQGLQARSIAAGDYVSSLSVTKGDATATYDVSGITVYSGGIDFNDGSTTTFYGGSGQTVSLALTAETRDGYRFKQYAASQGSLSDETTDTPTLTMPAASGETLYTSYTATAGTTGYHGETDDYTKLVDNIKTVDANKWMGTFTPGVYAEFNTPTAIVPTGYVITTANDAVLGSWDARSPKTWKLYGKLHEGDSWTLLDDVTDGQLPAAKFTDVSYSIANTGAYKYFRYEITAIKGTTDLFQLAELQLKGYDAVVISAEYDPLYDATFADDNDNDGWTISPTQQIVGGTVTVSYTGENKVKSVTVTNKYAIAHSLAASVVGDIVGTDGNAYAVAEKDKLPVGVTAAGVVTYKSGEKGFVVALQNLATQYSWDNAFTAAAAYTPAVSGQTWKLGTKDELTNAILNDYAIKYGYITAAGGTFPHPNNYWSATEVSGYTDRAWRIWLNESNVPAWHDWDGVGKTYECQVRPIIAF